MGSGWNPEEEFLRECGVSLLKFGGVCEQSLVSSSHLEAAVWLGLPGVGSGGSSV